MERDIRRAVTAVRWPPGGRRFTIYPEVGKKRGMGNGVVPIKLDFVKNLRNHGWEPERRHRSETPVDEEQVVRPGAFDAWLDLNRYRHQPFVVEWETGNVSSSHRALNKMALGIFQGNLSGGALVVPSKRMARFLTDRIGTFEELRAYFPLWRYHKPDSGYLFIVPVEHDAESTRVPRIPKMTAGRALG